MSNKKKNIDRREFIKKSALFASVLSLPGIGSCSDDDPRDPHSSDCLTTEDILGPFYKAEAPFGDNIIPADNTNTPLIITGKVISNCEAVLSDALVEIWNADENGEYDLSEQFKFRGRYKTESGGIYRFKTIIPGRYLNGNTYRPSHIHFRITAPGHQELVSQLYFKDDPFITKDPWASSSKAVERILIVEKDANEIDTVNFDIHLKSL